MNRTLLLAVALLIVCAAGAFVVSKAQNSRHAATLAAARAAWEQEKSELESALAGARASRRMVTVPVANAPALPPAPVGPEQASPAELVARLRTLKFAQGPGQTRAARQAVHDLEELIAAGAEALPAIREFLARNEEVDFASAGQGKGWRVTDEFVAPPSLRFGLLDAVKRIGGAEGEKLLADILGTTGRGVELAWLARTLQEMAPDKYRETALTAARELLARAAVAGIAGGLDRNDREHLFSVLALYGDTSYVSAAQGQLVQADGALDASALRYLQRSLGPQAVALAAQTWNDPRLTDPAKKEPLARLALNYVGADAQANEFYQAAINDLTLPKDHRRNLIEDLNQDGFADRKNLTERDLPLIQNRLALIEQLAPVAADPVNTAAFAEAYKDLLKMRERILRPPAPAR